MPETRIKEIGNVVSYTTIRGETEPELFENIYTYFKSNQYCWQVKRVFEDKELKARYENWIKCYSEKMWWKHATGRDFD